MRKLLLAIGLLLGGCLAAQAQVPCIGVNGVNSYPQPGITCNQEPAVNSYQTSQIGIVPASSATDIACMDGAANIVIRLQSVRVSGSAGTLINVPVTLTKHASLDSGGTSYSSGNQQFVPYALDPSNGSAKATGLGYSANPTINDSSPGLLDTVIVPFSATGTLLGNPGVVIDYSNIRLSEAPTLRTAVQQLCVNLNATSPSSGVVNVSWKWTEATQ